MEGARQIIIGDRLPYDATVFALKNEKGSPCEVKIGELFEGKKVIMFGIPGAFTSVCSSKHVPQFLDKYDEFRAAGVDQIICIAANDPYVMSAWAKSLNVDDKIQMISDIDATFHREVGLAQHIPGMGERGLRFSLFASNGIVQLLNVELPGTQSYKISGPETLLKQLVKLPSEE